MKPFALKARYLLTMDGRPPTEGGVVTIADQRIVAVGENASGKPAFDLGDVALLPGFVNAHTHLEFSDLDRPLGKPGMSLPQWIRAVLAYRMQKMAAVDFQTRLASGLIQSPIARGLSQAGDTTTIGDISTQRSEFHAYSQASADVVIFSELLGLPRERLPGLTAQALAHMTQNDGRGNSTDEAMSHMTAGLSPHAPYSVHPEVVRMAAELSHSRGNVPLAMHIAESREELELLAAGTGPFRELLKERGVWQADAISLGSRPLDYLQMLGRACRALVIHGNYLQRDELEYLAQQRERMTLVYCPRTHAYFQHEIYPLEAALKLGVAVAIGTDSLASNPDLSMLAELRFLAQKFPRISPEAILHLGTAGGARSLGFEQQVGTLEPGKLANLVAISLPAKQGEPYEQILQGQGQRIATWHRGQAPRPFMGEQDDRSCSWFSNENE
jgi:cytosine/adenosine deaminase-related metal-dependent hydrolase